MQIDHVDYHFDDGQVLTVVMNDEAVATLRATGTSVEHIICHHREHLERPDGCHYAQRGLTVMGKPDDDLVLVVAGPGGDGAYAVFAMTRDSLRDL